jgi:hypothetical protein
MGAGDGSMEAGVRASLLYRVASGLLCLMAVGHTYGFRQSDPAWGLGSLLRTMQSQQFSVQGFTRTYWDFFLGAGFTVGVLYAFAAILAWQLGGLPGSVLRSMKPTAWSFAACLAAVSILSWRFLFWIPVILSALVATCLGAAAWSSGRHAAASGPEENRSSRAGAT